MTIEMRLNPCLIVLVFLMSCTGGARRASAPVPCAGHAQYFRIPDDGSDVVIISPYDGRTDTLDLSEPVCRLVCMSSSYVAALSQVGETGRIVGVSGLRYLSDTTVNAVEVGFEAALDYEGILASGADLVLACGTSATPSDCWKKLESLGVRVLFLYDHLEEDPLARAEYVRLLGRICGAGERADSAWNAVVGRYAELAAAVPEGAGVKVLMNIPYGGQWFVPGRESYMSRLFAAAGASILGSRPGAASSTISMEEAFSLSAEADCWFHPGWCLTRRQLEDVHQLFREFPVLSKDNAVYNNTRRSNLNGGNDYWESGAVRPDLVLEDLVRILHPEALPEEGGLHYYIEVQ